MFRTALISLASVMALTGTATANDTTSRSMWFTDRHATAYYQLNEKTGEVTTTVEVGAEGGNTVESRRYLADGQAASMTLTGAGANAIAVTLTVWRKGRSLTPSIETQVLAEQYATN